MRITVILATRNRDANEIFIKHNKQILKIDFFPVEIKNNVSLDVCCYYPESINVNSLGNFLIDKINDNAEAVLMLVDKSLGIKNIQLNRAIFLGEVEIPNTKSEINNLLSKVAARFLKNFGYFLQLVASSSTNLHSVILPIRNFKSINLQELDKIFHNETLSRDFHNNIKDVINRLVKMRGPKRRSTYPYLYFIDDNENYFCYGKEHHSQFETGGNHTIICQLTGLLRFGIRLDNMRHFNVSKSNTNIKAAFKNCHDEIVNNNGTHVNMFSNDFHK